MKRLTLFTGTVTLLAWFLISNHCILGAVVSPPEAATVPNQQDDCCPMHGSKAPAPSPTKKKEAPQICCKNLPATALKKTEPLRTFVAPLLATLLDHNDLFERCWTQTLPLCLDTGPPEACSFSELVLQRSLLAHAPPSLA